MTPKHPLMQLATSLARLSVALLRHGYTRLEQLRQSIQHHSEVFVRGRCPACLPMKRYGRGWPAHDPNIQCIRPAKHAGPHVASSATGVQYTWELDPQTQQYRVTELLRPGEEQRAHSIPLGNLEDPEDSEDSQDSIDNHLDFC